MNAATALLLMSLLASPVWFISTAQEKNRQDRASGDIHFRMFATGNTGIQFPRLTAYRDVTTMNRVNAQIDQLAKQFGCDEPHSQGDWYKVWSRVEYATRDVLSIYVRATYNCGGAYPTNEANMSVPSICGRETKWNFQKL